MRDPSQDRGNIRTERRKDLETFPAFRRIRRLTLFIAKISVVAAICFFAMTDGILHGAGFADPGFENYAMNAGDFVKPTSGPWLFGVNTDAGVVEPYSPNSSNAPLDTWSATFAAHEGQQYASTYAGSDTIRQTVSFGVAGDYMISVYAASPDGSVTIPQVGNLQLENGEFTFTLDNVWFGSLQTVPKGSNWDSYSAVFSIDSPGDYKLGIRTTKAAPYFINFDSFSVQPVPEPSTIILLAAAATSFLLVTWRQRQRS